MSLNLENLKSKQEIHIALQEIYKADLFSFARDVCGYKDIIWDTHGDICESLEDDCTRKLLCIPRSCFKSSLATIAYSLWMLVRCPDLRILIDSELYSNSKNFLREAKAILKSEAFINIFGDLEGPIWTEGEIVINTRKKPLKESSISCSGIGAEKTGMHYDIIIGDDLSSTQSVNTPELAQKVINHYRLYTSLLEPWGVIVIVGTRYSERDLIGYVLENEMGLKTMADVYNYNKEG